MVQIYTVYDIAGHEMPDDNGTGAGSDLGLRAERFVFIRDGISILALISPIIWALWHRLWLVLVIYFGALMAIVVVGMALGLGESQLGLLSTFFNIGIALEANNIRRWMLERKGARMIGVVSGGNLEECEYRFFTSWLKTVKQRPSAPSLQTT